jgi:anti-sigma regulatory factor (Ser/Thr protein kinase)
MYSLLREKRMTEGTYSFKLKNTLAELNTLCRNLEKYGNSIGLTPKCIFQLNLALDELFTNIVSYSYKDENTHWITISLSHTDNTLVISIEDSGAPFDPVSIEISQPNNTIEDCRIGGLGLHLVRKMVDDIVYERQRGKNIITMKKNIPKS